MLVHHVKGQPASCVSICPKKVGVKKHMKLGNTPVYSKGSGYSIFMVETDKKY